MCNKITIKISPCHQVEKGLCFAGNTDPPCSSCWVEIDNRNRIAAEYLAEYKDALREAGL